MSAHPSEEQIGKYVSRDLPAARLLEIDDHLAACEICMAQASKLRTLSAWEMQENLFGDEINEHLTFDRPSAYVDSTNDEVDREIADVHLRDCDSCSAEVENLLRLRATLGIAEPTSAAIARNDRPTWYEGIFRSAFFRFAAPAASIIITAVIVWNFFAAKSPTPISADAGPQGPSPLVELTVAPTPETDGPDASQQQNIVASLKDAGGRIELNDQGNITGLATHEFDGEIISAIRQQSPNVSTDARNLRSETGALMGNREEGLPFKLISPVGKVIETQAPTLTWQPLDDAEGYRVEIFDEDFNKVAESDVLKSMTWHPTGPLRRGKIYQWQVTAMREGKEVRSPVRPAPEARFKIIAASDKDRIDRARRSASNSHLVMGIVFAEAGLLDEAEREFRALSSQNPRSPIARALLAKVRSSR